MKKHAILLLAVALAPSPAVSQDTNPLSVELGLGVGTAGHGGGLSGKFAVRVIPRTWGIGVKLMGMDGARRRASPTICFIFCDPIESFTEKSVLIHRRIVTSGGSRIYIGAGVGRLTGRRFIGSSTEFDTNVSELGMSFEASISVPPGAGIRLALAAQGHIGPGGVTASFTVGVAVGG